MASKFGTWSFNQGVISSLKESSGWNWPVRKIFREIAGTTQRAHPLGPSPSPGSVRERETQLCLPITGTDHLRLG